MQTENNPILGHSSSTDGVPSKKAQSWGLLISIIVIVLMIVTGAFYAWGKRIAQNTPPASFIQ